MLFKYFPLLLIIVFNDAAGSVGAAKKAYYSRESRMQKTKTVIVELVKAKRYYAAQSFMKDFVVLYPNKIDSELDSALEQILTKTGLKQFETLPVRFLGKTPSPSLKYLAAKKYYKKNKMNAALNALRGFTTFHSIYPYAAHLKANILSFKGRYEEALSYFKDCEKVSESRLSSENDLLRKASLEINRDYCTLGYARTLFASKDFSAATLKYLDIPKTSPIWPEVLFDEAWSSFYEGNVNRTLGKLVTYKAPVFDYIFNPEIEVLRSLSYMKLCLYDDAKKESDNFWSQNLKSARSLRRFINSKGKNFSYYYRLMSEFEKSGSSRTLLLTKILRSVEKDITYKLAKINLSKATDEFSDYRGSGDAFNKVLAQGVGNYIRTQQNVIGSYVRQSLVEGYAKLYRAFEGMNYIKLEVLAKQKAQLYRRSSKGNGGKRGDQKNVERNEKQYFWDFNGEFWADELGDYVFALKSEC